MNFCKGVLATISSLLFSASSAIFSSIAKSPVYCNLGLWNNILFVCCFTFSEDKSISFCCAWEYLVAVLDSPLAIPYFLLASFNIASLVSGVNNPKPVRVNLFQKDLFSCLS